MKANVDHIGILVKDINKAIKFYGKLLGWKIPEEEPYKGKIGFVDTPGHKYKYAMLKAPNNVYLELLEPVEGPWVKTLKEKGEGTFSEICVEVDDIEELADHFREMGITLLDADIKTPIGKEKKYVVTPSGNKIFYVPLEKTMGTQWEFIQRPIKVR